VLRVSVMLPRTTREMLNVRSKPSSITLGAPMITCSAQQPNNKLATHGMLYVGGIDKRREVVGATSRGASLLQQRTHCN
jgi:hypothetical protein